MTLNITIKGSKELSAKFRRAGGYLNKEMIKAMNRATIIVHRRAATYPPAPYRRTRLLGNSWEIEVKPLASDVRGIVSNPVDYGPYVMDPIQQTSIHRRIWSTTQQILEEKTKEIVGLFETAVRKMIGRF